MRSLVVLLALLPQSVVSFFAPAPPTATFHHAGSTTSLFAQQVGSNKKNVLKGVVNEAGKAASAVDKATSQVPDPDVLASAVGGALMVAFLDIVGGAGDSIPPEVAAGVAGAAAFVAASQEESVGRTTRIVLGKPTRAAGKKVITFGKELVARFLASVQAAPGKLADFFKAQAEKAMDELMNLPSKIVGLLVRKSEETMDNFKRDMERLPQTIADFLVKRMEALGNELKNAPGRMWDSATKSIDEKIEETKQSLSIFGRGSLTGDDGDMPVVNLKTPHPPSIPPPDDKFM